MYHILDPETLEQIMAADSAAITQTLTAGGYHGMPVPGDPEWDPPIPGSLSCHLISLALHYFTTRHPDTQQHDIILAAQLVDNLATGVLRGYPINDIDPRYDRYDAMIQALAGGQPPPPSEIVGFTSPLDPQGRPILPGGDRSRFTAAALDILETLIFEGEDQGRAQVERFLAQIPDEAATRAAEIFHYVYHWSTTQPVHCFDCDTGPLDDYYTSSTGGYDLCPACFQTREARGAARKRTDP